MDHQHLFDLIAKRRKFVAENPKIIFPWRKPCVVKVLLVADGALNFGMDDFGLQTFISTLIDEQRSYVRFEITLAHLRATVTDAEVMAGAPGIARSIKDFTFDDPSHFKPAIYDEVWLFGIETDFRKVDYPKRIGDQTRFKADRLGDAELDVLTAHMNRGGGIFATGDHGNLGIALSGSVDRVRNMRYWDDYGNGEVGMATARRNDSNAIGPDLGSQFSDQSDDVPQRLDLKLYTTRGGLLREARYPHPVMCSRLGRIDVFPDHPHEGEVRVPPNLSGTCRDGTEEYPDALDGSGPISPEVIASGRVPAGNTAVMRGMPTKPATEAHCFDVVSAYDGHRCGVGRVVCDSTWHHFVNVNLIGVVEGGPFDDFATTPYTHTSKHDGFLGSEPGKLVLAKIKDYFLNVAVWIAPPDRIRCMQSRLWWELLWSDRLVEATLLRPDLELSSVTLVDLFHIGVHARDVLGRLTSICQTVQWIRPIFDRLHPPLLPWLDPWAERRGGQDDTDWLMPWIDIQPLVDIAVGGALVALRTAHPYPVEDIEFDDKASEIAMAGAVESFRRGVQQFRGDLQAFDRLIRD